MHRPASSLLSTLMILAGVSAVLITGTRVLIDTSRGVSVTDDRTLARQAAEQGLSLADAHAREATSGLIPKSGREWPDDYRRQMGVQDASYKLTPAKGGFINSCGKIVLDDAVPGTDDGQANHGKSLESGCGTFEYSVRTVRSYMLNGSNLSRPLQIKRRELPIGRTVYFPISRFPLGIQIRPALEYGVKLSDVRLCLSEEQLNSQGCAELSSGRGIIEVSQTPEINGQGYLALRLDSATGNGLEEPLLVITASNLPSTSESILRFGSSIVSSDSVGITGRTTVRLRREYLPKTDGTYEAGPLREVSSSY